MPARVLMQDFTGVPALVVSIYETATRDASEGTPLLVLTGKEYGTGSSRDWAGKGPALLGVRVVIAESFERLHPSKLVSMGILPLQFRTGDSVESLGLTDRESIDSVNEVTGPDWSAGREVTARARR
jgi:aconitate hydratase